MRIHSRIRRALVALSLLIGFYVLCCEADVAKGQPPHDPAPAPPMFAEEEGLPMFADFDDLNRGRGSRKYLEGLIKADRILLLTRQLDV